MLTHSHPAGPPGSEASAGLPAEVSGDSVSVHRLVCDLRDGRAVAGRRGGPALANRELAGVLEHHVERLSPAPEGSVFTWDTGSPGVPFLPRERLLSDTERSAALARFTDVLSTGAFTSGAGVGAFESALAEFLGMPHALATSSGTDALVIALHALGVGPGDEVIMPANSFAATENAVLACGAVPVLADVRDDYTLDPDRVAERITGRTRAVLPVHLHGKLAVMAELEALCHLRGLALVEDACQAIGVTGVGLHSDAAVLSFNPYKNFGVCGKAGAVVTRASEVAHRCRAIGYHGFEPGRKNVKAVPLGFNAGMDNTQAEIALGLLPHLSLNSFRRSFLASRYVQALAPLARSGALGVPDFTADHAWHLFPVQVEPTAGGRDALRDRLRKEHCVETDVYYPVLTHRQAPFAAAAWAASADVPRTERLNSRVLHLPLHNGLSIREQDRTIEALYDCLHHHAK